MYNRLKTKRHLIDEDEPPDKKLVTEADLYIKQLAKKQQNTTTTLQEQLAYKNNFEKGSEFLSLTTSGTSSLAEFSHKTQELDERGFLKSLQLSDSDIDFYFESKSGLKQLKNKHKNLNDGVLQEKLERIQAIISKSQNKPEKISRSNHDRQNMENMLAAKPQSVETKLLKFALENEKNSRETLLHPMDNIKSIEKELIEDLNPINIEKIRKKARSLGRQIDELSKPIITAPPVKSIHNKSLATCSKWDIESPPMEEEEKKQLPKTKAKLYSCKPKTLYTIKNGAIVKLDQSTQKLSVEEIRNLPKFQNYDPGEPSSKLFLKNLAGGLNEQDLKMLFEYLGGEVVSIKMMNGRMKGQAFIEFPNVEMATEALHMANGKVIKNKPVIIEFGRK